MHDYPVQIREGHLDTFGHVNNAVYLQLFEDARWEIVTSRGYGLSKVLETGIGPTILEVNLKFRRELRNREKIIIRTSIQEVRGKIQVLRQIMLNERGEEACVADFTISLFDTKARKLIDPTPEWKAAIGLP